MWHVGVVLNANWAQMADFALGWVGIDFAGDDGRKFGLWPWQSDPAAPETPAARPAEPPRSREGQDVAPRPSTRPPAPVERKGQTERLDDQP